jgi:mannose-6-phosphate isomerase-like protein (cupin superfamily)
MSSAMTIIRNAGEGELRRFFKGGLLTMKLTADETAGTLMLFADELSEGKMTPLHVHAHEDELLFVLEGEILVHVDGSDHAVGRDGLAFVPRDVPHAFLVTSAPHGY